MIDLENIQTNESFSGEDIEYFVDDDSLIGEVYLDGNLIFQSLDVIDEEQLEAEFYKQFFVKQDEAFQFYIISYLLKRNVMTSNYIYTELEKSWNEFTENHSKFMDKGNRAAGTRARKAIGELKKLVTEYRKQSVAESKKG